jgi:hypothetical protein
MDDSNAICGHSRQQQKNRSANTAFNAQAVQQTWLNMDLARACGNHARYYSLVAI